MSDQLETRHARLIERLSQTLEPVQILPSPWRRAAIWFCAALWAAGLLATFADFAAMRLRFLATPDLALSETGAILTAVLASVAAFQTSIPGRSAAWAWLPLPALALWLGSSTAGCLRLAPAADTIPEPPMHGMACMWVLLFISLPMSALLMIMLMRACPLRPGLTALLGGLASAGAAAAILALIHPFDANAEDLLLHLAGVVIIVAATRAIGAGWLRRPRAWLAPRPQTPTFQP